MNDATRPRARQRGRRARRRLVIAVAVTASLAIAGPGAAFALWSVTSQLDMTVQAAQTGLMQVAQPANPLATIYDSDERRVAGSLSLTNTGSRDARYAVELLATSVSDAGLPAAILVEAAVVGSPADCTVSAALSSVTSGALSTAGLELQAGALAPGATVVVCVKTSMSLGDIMSFAGNSVDLALRAELDYAAGAWTVEGSTIPSTQHVATRTGFVPDSSARYRILNDGVCLVRHSLGVNRVTRDPDCNGNQSQWRIAETPEGLFTISEAVNSTAQPSAPRWQLASAETELTTQTAADVAAQHWAVQTRDDGLLRFVNEATGSCATVAEALWPGVFGLRGAPCDDLSPAQGFAIELVATPAPPAPHTMACTGNGTNFIDFSWPVNAGYEGETVYRISVGGIFVMNHGNGYWPHAQMTPSMLPVASYGSGERTVTAEQSVQGSAWTLVAAGSIVIDASTNNLSCG